jgi:UDP-N-acetylmuramate dehydrogenase
MSLKDKLSRIKDLDVSNHKPLKDYTSFKIGGPAEVFLKPRTITALQKVLSLLADYQIPLFILGKGSNILVADQGYKGIVIYTGDLNQIEIKSSEITAGAGITLSALANKAMEAGLTGLEFASGIPGTLGGALYMNAGAYQREMKDVVTAVVLLDYQGRELIFNQEDLKLSYRYSILQERPLVVVKVKLLLKPGSREEIKEYMLKINRERREKQPLEWPSAGSTFKRPAGNYAGLLIEKAGLKGTRIGDAQVSEKHAGFIINRGSANASDVKKLIELVQKRVYEKSGIMLEPEPRFIGDF